MNFKTKAAALGAVVALAVTVTATMGAPSSSAVGRVPASAQSAGAGKNLGLGPQQATFVPFTNAGCRVADTRGLGEKGKLTPGHPVSFQAQGLCNIPAQAVAIQGSLTAVNTSGPGWLRLGVHGTSGVTALSF